MNISLRIICAKSDETAVMQKARSLLAMINPPEPACFEPYWKDGRCVVLDTCGEICDPNYLEIERCVRLISGSSRITITETPAGWECSHYALCDEAGVGCGLSFVSCELFNLPDED